MNKYSLFLDLQHQLNHAEEVAENNKYDDFAYTNGSQERCEQKVNEIKMQIKDLQDTVEDDDYTMSWEFFTALHPNVTKEEYEMGVKRFQEM